MKENESALYSQYIIDGIRCSATPAELLEECMNYDEPLDKPARQFEDIIDEATDPPLSARTYETENSMEYIRRITPMANADRPFRMLYPDHFTRLQIAKALLSRLWSKGHFRLGDLRLWAQWEWNTRPIGNMTAFYESVRNAGDYIYGLGTYIEDYIFKYAPEYTYDELEYDHDLTGYVAEDQNPPLFLCRARALSRWHRAHRPVRVRTGEGRGCVCLFSRDGGARDVLGDERQL